MDQEIEIMHVVLPHKMQSENNVNAWLSSDFNRKAPPQTVYDDLDCVKSLMKHSPHAHDGTDLDPVDLVWNQRISQNPRLFNATKFRVDSIKTAADGIVLMCLGVTDYKEFLGTNWAPYASPLQTKGMKLFGNSQVFLSDVLGVGASVLTADNFMVFLCRSEHCAEAPSMWDVPGGHAEPKEIIGEVPLQDIDLNLFDQKLVVREIFDSIIREIVDEVNIPRECLSAPLYTGTHRNLSSAGRPSLAFEIQCTLSKEEVLSFYNKGSQLEADESTQILFISLDDVPHLSEQQPEVWSKMAPSGKGNLIALSIARGLKSFTPG